MDIERYQLPEEVRVAAREGLGIDRSHVVFICIGELNKNKNQKWLLEAWKEIEDENRMLLIVGDGKLRNQLEAFERDNRIERVMFLGYRDDIPELLAASDVLLSVSKREGLPKNVMEAMASGKPVIGTNVRGTRDLIMNKENGLLVDLGNSEQLIDALRMFSKSMKIREHFGPRSRNLVEVYSVERVLEEIKGVYNAPRS